MSKRILHTESSPGWGGQELRILREAEGMRERGYEVILAVREGGGLVKPALEAGFHVEEIPFRKSHLIQAFSKLISLIRKQRIEIVNTHSSLDAWLGGIAGKISGCRVIRTRHLSTPIRRGWNSRFLYNWLADTVVTTCAAVARRIRAQARLPAHRCLSIPTGVDPRKIAVDPAEVVAFREKYGISSTDVLAGTLCVLRGWKGVSDLLHAAKLLENVPHLKWLVVGSGASEDYFRKQWRELKLEEKVIFAGHIEPPYTALAAMDIFLLLSWAHEGVSQASLQAAWLKKPLITTAVGGLREVCLDGETGYQVSARSPSDVAKAVKRLLLSSLLRQQMGEEAHTLVATHFTLEKTLDGMERVFLGKMPNGCDCIGVD